METYNMVIEEGIPIVLVSRGHDPHPSLKVDVSMLAVGISFGLMTAMTTVSLCLLHLNDEKTLWYCALLWALTNAILGKVMMWGLVNLAARSREPSRSRSFPLTSMEASFLSGHIMAASTIYISVACYLDGPSIFVVLFTIVIVAVIFGLGRFIHVDEVEDESSRADQQSAQDKDVDDERSRATDEVL